MKITDHAAARWAERFPGQDAAARWAERFPGQDADELYKLACMYGPATKRMRRQIRLECPEHTEHRENVRYFMNWKNRIVFVVDDGESVVTVFKLRMIKAAR